MGNKTVQLLHNQYSREIASNYETGSKTTSCDVNIKM